VLRTLRKHPVATAVAVVVTAATLVTAAALTRPSPAPEPLGTKIPTFQVRSHVNNMYPGRVATLRARIDNPFGFPIVIRLVRAKVLNASTTCVARNLRIRAWHGRLTVPSHRHRKVLLSGRMPATAPTACQGVRFPIVFAGRAVRA
jgi:hypothetical protein